MSETCQNTGLDAQPPATKPTRRVRKQKAETSATHLVMQAIAAAQGGRRAQAVTLLDRALQYDPHHLDALLWRGGLSEPHESLTYLEQAYSLAPEDERVREALAWARRQAGVSDCHALGSVHAAATVTQPAQSQTVATPEPPVQPEPETSVPMPPTGRHPCRRQLAYIGRAAQRLYLAAAVAGILLVTLALMVSLAWFGEGSEASPAPPTPPDAVDDAPSAPVTATLPAYPTLQPTVPLIILPTPCPTPSPTPTGPSPLDLAWKGEDWPLVVALVQEMVKATPTDAELTEKLFAAHYNYAARLLRNDRPAEALAQLDLALTVRVDDPRALAQRKVAQLHVQAASALSAGDFTAAIRPLRTLYEQNPADALVKAKLYQAYVGQARALEKNGRNAEAYLVYETAAKVDSQGAEAQAALTRLRKPTSTPTPRVTNKKIEVDIAKQQVIVWENGKVLWRFKASTGKAPYLTRTGNFKILSKMPNAYSSAMLWGMPYWMGIYYAGKWENGFHGMARVGKSQTVLPDSVLGRPATRGCIMLSDRDAKRLYQWAEVGTPVWIH